MDQVHSGPFLTSWHLSESLLKTAKEGSQPKEISKPAGKEEHSPKQASHSAGKISPIRKQGFYAMEGHQAYVPLERKE
jgi:hypothetical protein